MAVVTHYSAKG